MSLGPLGNIASRWRDLSGRNYWNGLLHPLDSDLRQYLIHYGNLAQATYDNFIMQKMSPFSGGSRFGMQKLFFRTGLTKGNPIEYKPVKYLYATASAGSGVPDSFIMTPSFPSPALKETNWMGYIAVATDKAKAILGRRDIVVAWRGTIQPLEWMADFDGPLTPANDIVGVDKHARVHHGFHSVYTSANPLSTHSKTSARQQVLRGVKDLVNQYKGEVISVTVTGHSLGAALATMSAADIVANGINRSDSNASKSCPVTAFCYACPRTGDANFKKACDSMRDLRILRITNTPDMVPKVPPTTIGYTDIGQNLEIDSRRSPYLMVGGFVNYHSLEVYLHVIAGTQGLSSPFRLEVPRNIALVNKYLDALKHKYMIPAAWWRPQNSGMVQHEDGSWSLHDYSDDEDNNVVNDDDEVIPVDDEDA